ncbi:porin [Burkholderia pseudomallei]|nr:porin [Burkholderia pseudomallei]
MLKLTRVAVPAMLLVCNNVWAQSSVVLYGVIDAGFTYLTNAQTGKAASGALSGSHQFAFTDGATRGIGGSRWGLKGSEDLGGGLSAVFTMESGFMINNGTLGQGGAAFGRQIFVGFDSPWGIVTAGRQYDTEADFVSAYTPYMIVGLTGALPGDIDGDAHTRRVNNSIKYKTPLFHGFQAGAMYSLGGQAGDYTHNQVLALGVSYSLNAFSMGAGYYNSRNPNLATFGNNPNSGGPTVNNLGSSGTPTSPQSNPVYAGYASAHSFEVYAAGLSYAFGPLTTAALFAHVAFENLGDLHSGPNPLHYAGSAIFNNAELSLMYKISPVLLFGGAYTYTRNGGANGRGGANYQQGIVGVQYFLSKRTELYASAEYQVASGTDSLGQHAVANIALLTPSSNTHQLAARVGLLHRF